MPEQVWLSLRQAAERAHVSPKTIAWAIRAGELQAGRTHGLVRIRPEAVDAWLKHH